MKSRSEQGAFSQQAQSGHKFGCTTPNSDLESCLLLEGAALGPER